MLNAVARLHEPTEVRVASSLSIHASQGDSAPVADYRLSGMQPSCLPTVSGMRAVGHARGR